MTVRREEALAALTEAVDRMDLPLTVKQVERLMTAVEPFLARVPPPPRLVDGKEDRHPVPSGPTITAIVDVLEAGWPLAWQAREAGLKASDMSQVLKRDRVYRRTEERVLAMAARLKGLDPEAAGVARRVAVRARNEAARRRAAGREAA